MKQGPVELAIRNALAPPATLGSMARGAPFIVREFTPDALVLVLGRGNRTPIPWPALEATVRSMPGGEWMAVGSRHTNEKLPGTFEALLHEHYSARSPSSYVVVVLERAGIVEVDRRRPVHVRKLAAPSLEAAGAGKSQ